MALPPGPALPPVLQTLRWIARPASTMVRCQRRYGDCFTLRLVTAGDVVLVSDPAAIKQIFTGDPEVLRAGEANVVVEPVLGSRSILLLDGAEHLRERRLMLPAFRGERMQAYADSIERIAEREFDRWPLGQPFRLHPRLTAITLEVILSTVFGMEEGERRAELRRRVLRMIHRSRSRIGMLPVLRDDHGRYSPGGMFRALVREIDEPLLAEIADRRAGRAGYGPGSDDVLSLLLQARDEDGSPMSDATLRDELMTLLVAGHETTGTSLAWTFERLLRHPRALAALEAEIEDGGEEYLDAVIRESLRLRPVLPIVARRCAAPYELLGHELPVGTIVSPCIFLTHRRADLYPEPEAFRPERFLGRAPDTYAWLPFGGGVRRCLGAGFALLEMRIVLRTILRRASLRVPADPAGEPIVRGGITLMPRRGSLVALERRGPRSVASAAQH